jgi:hypothetical protein
MLLKTKGVKIFYSARCSPPTAFPRPAPAGDDRIGGWQFMYQLLESDSWVITCAKLIDCLPLLVRDDHRVEDIRKTDGDDPADAARYGLVSGGRLAGVGAGLHLRGFGQPGATQRSPNFRASHYGGSPGARFGVSDSGSTARFVTRHAARRTNRRANHRHRSNIARNSLAAPRGRSTEKVASPQAAPPPPQVSALRSFRIKTAADEGANFPHSPSGKRPRLPLNQQLLRRRRDEVSAEARRSR